MSPLVNVIRGRWRIAKENHLFWGNLLLLACTVLVTYIYPGPVIDKSPSDFRIRLWGMALQLIGAITVWLDLTGAARTFGKPSFLANTLTWAKRLIFGHGVAVGAACSVAVNVAASGRGKARRTPPPAGSPLESRIETLEYNLTKVDEDLSQAFRAMDQTEAKLREQISDEARKREAAHKELEKSLQDSIVGNYASLAFGAFWVMVGIVISALAPEIAKVVAGQRALAWAAM